MRAMTGPGRWVAVLLLASVVASCGGSVETLIPPIRGDDAPAPQALPRPPMDTGSFSSSKLAQLARPPARPPRIPDKPPSARLAGWPAPGGDLPAGFLADRIVVFKTERRMFLLQNDRPVKAYDIALGFAPRGHKTRQGDGRTPEGRYYITERNPNSQFYLSLRISYPNEVDIARARSVGADPGGDIMIHGLPNADTRGVNRFHPRWDWTWGCVAVNNAEIAEIYETVLVGTPVDIMP